MEPSKPQISQSGLVQEGKACCLQMVSGCMCCLLLLGPWNFRQWAADHDLCLILRRHTTYEFAGTCCRVAAAILHKHGIEGTTTDMSWRAMKQQHS